jgi:hypothetical protein
MVCRASVYVKDALDTIDADVYYVEYTSIMRENLKNRPNNRKDMDTWIPLCNN